MLVKSPESKKNKRDGQTYLSVCLFKFRSSDFLKKKKKLIMLPNN